MLEIPPNLGRPAQKWADLYCIGDVIINLIFSTFKKLEQNTWRTL